MPNLRTETIHRTVYRIARGFAGGGRFAKKSSWKRSIARGGNRFIRRRETWKVPVHVTIPVIPPPPPAPPITPPPPIITPPPPIGTPLDETELEEFEELEEEVTPQ